MKKLPLSFTLLILLCFSTLGVFLIDWSFHYFFTSPMETIEYFTVKTLFLFVFAIIFFIFIKEKTYFKLSVFGIIFAFVFFLYYRGYELLYSASWYSRTPDITFIISNNTFFEGSTWFFVHFLTFMVPVIILSCTERKRLKIYIFNKNIYK